MKYLCIKDSQQIEADDIASLVKHLEEKPRSSDAEIRINLPISLSGKVKRTDDPFEQKVVLLTEKGEKTFTRDTTTTDGDFGVTCDPKGDEVPIRTINLPFRNYEDELTDRGLVWVFPGNPAQAMLMLDPSLFEGSGESIADVIAAAEKTVVERVLERVA